jgi:hypothetical protein
MPLSINFETLNDSLCSALQTSEFGFTKSAAHALVSCSCDNLEQLMELTENSLKLRKALLKFIRDDTLEVSSFFTELYQPMWQVAEDKKDVGACHVLNAALALKKMNNGDPEFLLAGFERYLYSGEIGVKIEKQETPLDIRDEAFMDKLSSAYSDNVIKLMAAARHVVKAGIECVQPEVAKTRTLGQKPALT